MEIPVNRLKIINRMKTGLYKFKFWISGYNKNEFSKT